MQYPGQPTNTDKTMTDTSTKPEGLEHESQSSPTLSYPNETIQDILTGNQSLYEELGLTSKNIDAFYATVKTLYDREKYQEALRLFGMMAFYDHRDMRAWMGIASCLEMLKDYSNAIINYHVAALLEPTNPIPFFRMAQCWLAKKETAQAIQTLEQVLLLSANKKEHASLYQTALGIKNALQH